MCFSKSKTNDNDDERKINDTARQPAHVAGPGPGVWQIRPLPPLPEDKFKQGSSSPKYVEHKKVSKYDEEHPADGYKSRIKSVADRKAASPPAHNTNQPLEETPADGYKARIKSVADRKAASPPAHDTNQPLDEPPADDYKARIKSVTASLEKQDMGSTVKMSSQTNGKRDTVMNSNYDAISNSWEVSSYDERGQKHRGD